LVGLACQEVRLAGEKSSKHSGIALNAFVIYLTKGGFARRRDFEGIIVWRALPSCAVIRDSKPLHNIVAQLIRVLGAAKDSPPAPHYPKPHDFHCKTKQVAGG
jgi:hypothetical protein